MKYHRLFEPVTAGSLTLRNRYVMPAMCTDYGDSAGFVTQRLIDYYHERAANQVGLIVIEVACVAPGGRAQANQIGIDDDKFIPGLRMLAAGVTQTGAKCFIQLHHAGRQAIPAFNNGMQPLAPSPIPRRGGVTPREMTVEEIQGTIEAFAQAARRAVEAGFDGVELHFAHAYLIQQFLSPFTNKRRDLYGGDVFSRTKIALEIIKRVRQTVGTDYPLSARMCGNEYIKGGLTQKDAQIMAALFEEAGVNILDVSVGYSPSYEEGYFNSLNIGSIAASSRPYGCHAKVAEEIKKVVGIPVIAVGRLDDADTAEGLIADGKADMIAVGRGLIADPAYVSKVHEGKFSEIRACIACKRCGATLQKEANVRCTVNPEVGREDEYRIKPAGKVKRVVVVGGGPGGMESARVAALRGHKVTLLEKNSQLGGNLISAAGVSFKNVINRMVEYYVPALKQAGVEIKLNTSGNQENILALKPDVVILATGAVSAVPDIPGISRSNVVTAVNVLEGKAATGKNVIVAGGGDTGCEAAVYLAQRGKHVTIVEMRDTDWSDTDGLAPGMESDLRKWLFGELLSELPIDVVGKVTFREVSDKGLVVEDREHRQKLIPGDSIVVAAGMKSVNELKTILTGKVSELYEAGDCISPRKIIDAVTEAANVARLI